VPKLIKEPEDRREAVGSGACWRPPGKLHWHRYALGDHDGFVLGEAPDNTAVASALGTVAGSGAFSSPFSYRSTTVLVTVEEMLDALGRAQRIAYRPPRRLNRPSRVLRPGARMFGRLDCPGA
jgi:hypothetical protein